MLSFVSLLLYRVSEPAKSSSATGFEQIDVMFDRTILLSGKVYESWIVAQTASESHVPEQASIQKGLHVAQTEG